MRGQHYRQRDYICYMKYYGAIFILLLALSLRAQTNLVPNPSFEIYTSCPMGADINDAQSWFNPTVGTSNYFHSCVIYPPNFFSVADVPDNFAGYQYARTGQGYAGAYGISGSSYPDYREYIEVKLLDTLEAGKKYCVEFYLNLAGNSVGVIDQFGAYLSSDSILANNANVLPFIPQISNPAGNFLGDTLNWMLVAGEFVANGTELFLTIGNFSNDAITNIDSIPVSNPNLIISPYYYIDDVYVGACDTTPVPNDTLIIPNVFTPNDDGVNDVFTIQSEGIENLSCIIYNRWGVKVAELKSAGQSWDGRTTSGQETVEGFYYYIVQAKDREGKEITKTGYLHLLR